MNRPLIGIERITNPRTLLYPFAIAIAVIAGCGGPVDAPSTDSGSPESPIERLPSDGDAEDILKEVASKPRTEDDPIGITLNASSTLARAGAEIELSVVLETGPDYEIHGFDVAPPFFPTKLELDLPPGWSVKGDWEAPSPSRSKKSPGGSVYAGKTEFKRRIEIAKATPPDEYVFTCRVSYQACNAVRCLRPITSELEVVMTVSP